MSSRRLLTFRRPRDDQGPIDWDRLLDGRPHRLERDVDFRGDARSFMREVRETASGKGKSVLVVSERLHPDRCLWVQSADGEIGGGAPCVCGGRRLERIGGRIVRCDACGRTLVLPDPRKRSPQPKRVSQPSEPAIRPRLPPVRPDAATLADYSNVRLVQWDRGRSAVHYVGIGIDSDGRETLLVVREKLVDDLPVADDESPTGTSHRIVFAMADPWARFAGVVDDDDWEVLTIELGQ